MDTLEKSEEKINNNEAQNKKTNIFGIIAFGIIIASIVLIIINNNGTFSPLNKYKKTTANILKDYLSTKITKDEAIEKLELVEKQVEVEYAKNNDLDYSIFETRISNVIAFIKFDNIDKVMEFYNEIK